MSRWVGTLLVLCLVAGCGKDKPITDKVIYVPENDARMAKAMEKARATVDTFIVALKSPKPEQSSFSVKMPFVDGTHTEHMWLSRISYDGTNFEGTVNNEPEQVKNVKIGEKVSVEAAKISDWMYVEHRKLIGGETIRAMRESLSAAERAEFDKSIPFTLE